MINYSEEKIDDIYQNLYAQVAGYLPKNREGVDEWQKNLKEEIAEARSKKTKRKIQPSVKALSELIELNGIVRMYVEQMIDQVPEKYKNIKNTDELLEALNHIITMAPPYNPDPDKQNFFPMSSLFVYMMMTPAGEAIFRNNEFNDAIRDILQEWCKYLDSKKSQNVLNEGRDGWLSESAFWYNKLYDFEFDKSKPHWGWKSFNDYFHREIKPECRPIAGPKDKNVIVSANDGKVYNIESNVQPTDKFWLKGQPYSLINMLNNQYVDKFDQGTVFQSFLSGADYHRWHSPVSGVVRKSEIVNGLMFSDAESAGADTTAGTYSQGYQASVNTRALVFIESDNKNIGMVCVIPIGITEISSVTLEYKTLKMKEGKPLKVGQHVEKGDQLGYFSYGGSSMALVFQPGAIDRFIVPNRPSSTNPDDGPPIRVNAQIAFARSC